MERLLVPSSLFRRRGKGGVSQTNVCMYAMVVVVVVVVQSKDPAETIGIAYGSPPPTPRDIFAIVALSHWVTAKLETGQLTPMKVNLA
uniref:Secreted protein n=1 Tax=Haemonchus contortus TaxID=6289 RepID=A0A7I5E856_HAECO